MANNKTDQNLNLQPQSIEAEQAVLGAMLSSKDAITEMRANNQDLTWFDSMTEKQKELFKEKHAETYYDFEQQVQAYHEQKRKQEEKSKETIKQEPITNKITKE